MTDAKITIRPMTLGDVDDVMAIAESLAHAPRWRREAYEAAALDSARWPRRVALAAEDAGQVVMGFAISLLVGHEAELETICVAGNWQRKGAGRELLSTLLEVLRREQVTKVSLEVRTSNWAAQRLYRSCGFEETGRRPDYYADPKEDAVIMQRAL
jgi:[ribosomal protein S18]-alanine N-acetyltransferase